jgi:hypothetical protein
MVELWPGGLGGGVSVEVDCGVEERRRVRSQVMGSLTLRGHCQFWWHQPAGCYHRIVSVEPRHCPSCVLALSDAVRYDGFIIERRH